MDRAAAGSSSMFDETNAGHSMEGSTTQLDFETAMNDFHKMFPDLELEVIEAVLRANQGAVDATIDQLLLMTLDNEHEQLKKKQLKDKPSPAEFNSPTSEYSNVQRLTKLPIQSDARKEAFGKPLCVMRGWDNVLVGSLPPDFLRLECHFPRHKDFYIPDDITVLLQSHPEFVEVLKRNPEFLESLNREQSSSDHSRRQHDLTDAEFTDRLARMGRISRKKLTQLARSFFRGPKFSTRHVSTLNERSILCDEDEDWPVQSKSQEPSQKR